MGGCCGTTPAHIKALVEACKDAMPKPLTDKNLTLVSSYSHAVELGKMPMLIGERIILPENQSLSRHFVTATWNIFWRWV